MPKSGAAGLNLEHASVLRFAQVTGCCIMQWPLKYLGFPFGEHSCSKSFSGFSGRNSF